MLSNSESLVYVGKSDVSDIADRILATERLNLNDCLRLIKSDDLYALGLLSSELREKIYGNIATFVNNIILNYTNVCVTYCKFCAFYRPLGDTDAYTLSVDEIIKRVGTARRLFGITQVLIQGGHNPNLRIEYYEDTFRRINEKYPEIGIHGLSASEIDMISKVEKCSTKEVLSRLKDSGLHSLPGAGAEILDDTVKNQISPLKIKTDEWLRIMEEAHILGIKVFRDHDVWYGRKPRATSKAFN